MKKFMMPCGLCSAVPILKQTSPDGPKPCCNEVEKKKLIRPSELPIYTFDECPKNIPCAKKEDCEPSILEQGFGTIRRSLGGVVSQFEVVTDKVSNTINTGKEHSAFLVDYLRDDPDPWPRVGAITVGGLVGFLLGIRGGKFKKLVYTSAGSLAVAAFIYPSEARDGLNVAKHYMNVGYNFAYGVKPGDEKQLEIEWTTFLEKMKAKTPEDIMNDVISSVSTVASSVGSLTNKAIEAIKQEEAKPEEPTSKPKTS